MMTDKIGFLMLLRPIGYGAGSAIIGAIADKKVFTHSLCYSTFIVILLSQLDTTNLDAIIHKFNKLSRYFPKTCQHSILVVHAFKGLKV